MPPRVAVTGLGLVTALGSSAQETWEALLAGSCGLEVCSLGSVRAAAGFAKTPGGVSLKSRVLDLALAASREALSNGGGVQEGGPCGCVAGIGKPVLGNGVGLEPTTILAGYLRPNLAGFLLRELDLAGPAMGVSAACATGTVAVGLACQWIWEGRCSAVLAVSAESPVHPLYLAGFQRLGVLASLEGPAHKAVKPFDRRRTGFALGEGAAALLLEDEGRASGRGAEPLAYVDGFSQLNAVSHPVRFDAQGRFISSSLRQLMSRAGCRPDEVDYLNCHGTATPLSDAIETRAIKGAFGCASASLSLSSTKASTGHLLAAAGALEAAFTVLALRDGKIPPTLNLEESDPDCDLDFTPLRYRSRILRRAISLSFGFGGAIGALLFSKI